MVLGNKITCKKHHSARNIGQGSGSSPRVNYSPLSCRRSCTYAATLIYFFCRFTDNLCVACCNFRQSDFSNNFTEGITKTMKVKSANRFLLLFTIAGTFLSIFLTSEQPILKSFDLLHVASYILFAVIGIAIIKKSGGEVLQALPYNVPLKGKSALYIILLVFLLMPLAAVLSLLGATIFGDTLSYAQQMGVFDTSNFFALIFTTAVIPAIFEELFFRGFFFHPYKTAAGPRTAILLSGFLFGIFHLNFQQAIYATALGIFLGIIRELTGSMWAGTLYHFVNNGYSSLLQYISSKSDKAAATISKFPFERMGFETPGNTAYSIALCIVATAVSVFLVFKIAENEGRGADLKNFFRDQKVSNEKIITPALILSILFSFAVMIAYSLIMNSGLLQSQL